jgi:23S rRNA (cytidine1920-2'-O)/16S rRNA (cytidine1409-2'-O)-methyltransferase
MTASERYVGKGGLKLEFALEHFGVDPAGWVCADLGSQVGGFVDCLLQHGAARVYAVDTAYGALAWKLRQDPRVVVLERTNALHVTLPEPVRLVTADVGWTRQEVILPRALSLLAPDGVALSLLKTQYETDPRRIRKGRLPEEEARAVASAVIERLTVQGIGIKGWVESPLRGSRGNLEYWLLVRPGD